MGGGENGPAREGGPHKVVVGEPIVEDRDEGLPLGVPLVHRSVCSFPSLLHFLSLSLPLHVSFASSAAAAAATVQGRSAVK